MPTCPPNTSAKIPPMHVLTCSVTSSTQLPMAQSDRGFHLQESTNASTVETGAVRRALCQPRNSPIHHSPIESKPVAASEKLASDFTPSAKACRIYAQNCRNPTFLRQTLQDIARCNPVCCSCVCKFIWDLSM